MSKQGWWACGACHTPLAYDPEKKELKEDHECFEMGIDPIFVIPQESVGGEVLYAYMRDWLINSGVVPESIPVWGSDPREQCMWDDLADFAVGKKTQTEEELDKG